MVVDPGVETIELGSALTIIPDPNVEFRYQDVAAGRYHSRALPTATRAPNLGYVRHPFWVRLDLQNPNSAAIERVLVLRRGTKHRQAIWIDSGGSIRHLRIGQGGSVSGDVPSRHAAVRLQLPPNSSVKITIRFESRTGAVLDDALTRERTLAQGDLLATWSYGLLFGVGLAIGVYMLLLFAATQQRVYLSFGVTAVSGAIYQMHHEAFAFVGLWGPAQLAGNFTSLYAALIAVMSLIAFISTIPTTSSPARCRISTWMREQLDTIREGARRIGDIVRDLRTFSRLDEAEFKAVSIVESLRATVNLVRTRYRDALQFETQFQSDPRLEGMRCIHPDLPKRLDLLRQRQTHGEPAAAAGYGLYVDVAVVVLDDAERDRQAQASS